MVNDHSDNKKGYFFQLAESDNIDRKEHTTAFVTHFTPHCSKTKCLLNAFRFVLGIPHEIKNNIFKYVFCVNKLQF